MRKLSIVLLILAFGGVCFAQQTPLTKEQIEARLKNVQIEKRYLELQVEEATLKTALENMKKEAPKPVAPKKEEKK